MSNMNRHGKKWNVNEILSLQREYELLGWSIDYIAEKHCRTVNAIMHKLNEEGFADYNVLSSNYEKSKCGFDLELNLIDNDVDEDNINYDYANANALVNEEINKSLIERVCNLEMGFNHIRQLLNNLSPLSFKF